MKNSLEGTVVGGVCSISFGVYGAILFIAAIMLPPFLRFSHLAIF